MTTTVYTPSKTLADASHGSLVAFTQQASGVITLGSAIDVSAKLAIAIYGRIGRSAATAFTNEMGFRFEVSPRASGNDEWYPKNTFTSLTCKTAAASTTLNGATTAPNTTFVVASATGIVAGSWLYFRETGTPANSEWVRVLSVSGTTITTEESMTRNHTNGIAITSLAEEFIYEYDVSAYGRVRLVVDTASNVSGVTADVVASIVTLDNMTGT